jgi:hypothetical protein
LALAKTHPVNQNVIVELLEPFFTYEITKRMKEEKQNKTIMLCQSFEINQSYLIEFLLVEYFIQSDVDRLKKKEKTVI